MKIKTLELYSVKNFLTSSSFDFTDTNKINTISGKNGTGKTTIFKSILLCQQAYFASLIQDIDLIKKISNDLKSYFNNKNSYIKLTFEFINESKPEYSSIKLYSENYSTDDIHWSLEIENNDAIKKSWNLEAPKDLIVYVDSDKHFIEQDIKHENISIKDETFYTNFLIDSILFPERLFSNIYQRLINDYIRERLIPAKPRKDIYFIISKILLKELLPKIELSKFTGLDYKEQFVLIGKASSEKQVSYYDIRNFSSGEKNLFYLLLFINYVKQIGVLIIDEPENHFHEDLLIKFIKLLNDITNVNYVNYISQKGKKHKILKDENIKGFKDNLIKSYSKFSINQIFLLTHSKNLIYNNFSNGCNFYITDRLNSIPLDNYESVLREIGISSVYSKVLFVEGKSDSLMLDSFFNEFNIKVHPLGNCDIIIDTFRRIQKIKEFIRESQFCFLIDKDTRETEEIKRLRGTDSEFFDSSFIVLDRHEFENYLLEPSIYSKIIQKHQSINPTIFDLSISEIEAQIFQIASEDMPALHRKFINYENGFVIDKLKEVIRKRDLPTDKASYNDFINNSLNQEAIDNLKVSLIKSFEKSIKTYDAKTWKDEWISLCDGKRTFSKVINKFSRHLGIDDNRLRTEVQLIIKNDRSFQVNTIITNIIKKYEKQSV